MKEIMHQYFPNLETCIETHLQSFGVKDEQTNEKPAFTIMLTLDEIDYFKNTDFPKPTHFDFLIENNTQKTVYFVAIDACLLHKETGGQCDFAIFNDNTFAFVDIKDVKTNQRRYVKEKAISQLKNTFDILCQREFLLKNRKCMPSLALLSNNPIHNLTPKQSLTERLIYCFLKMNTTLLY